MKTALYCLIYSKKGITDRTFGAYTDNKETFAALNPDCDTILKTMNTNSQEHIDWLNRRKK